MVDFPPPDGPTRAVMRPGSATNDMLRMVSSSVRYENVTSLNSKRAALTLSGGRSSWVGSVGGLSITSNRIRTPTSDNVEVEVEPGQPLGGFVRQQKCGQEREEFAGRRSGIDHAVSGIDHEDRDREAGQRFHQRRRCGC